MDQLGDKTCKYGGSIREAGGTLASMAAAKENEYFRLQLQFSFKTGPDYLFCYDGYSTDLEHSIYFYIVGTVLCTLTPISIVIVLYYLIHNRIIITFIIQKLI
jgi:hypothetical protein